MAGPIDWIYIFIYILVVYILYSFVCLLYSSSVIEHERENGVSIITYYYSSSTLALVKMSARIEKNDSKEDEDAREGEEEEEETCGFCAYMKGGSCKKEFVSWEKCVDAAKASEEDFVEKCFEVTGMLRECMLKDKEYYGEMDEGGGDDGDDDDSKDSKEEEEKKEEEKK